MTEAICAFVGFLLASTAMYAVHLSAIKRYEKTCHDWSKFADKLLKQNAVLQNKLVAKDMQTYAALQGIDNQPQYASGAQSRTDADEARIAHSLFGD